MSSSLRTAFVAASVLALYSMSTYPNASAAENQYFVYIGTYGNAVQAFRYSAGTLTPLGAVGEVKNPSWVTTDPHAKYLFAASELEGKTNGGVAAFTIDHQTGKLGSINHVDSAGRAPCYVAVDKTGRMLIVANYSTGGVASYPIEQDGSIGQMASLMTAEGSGPDKARQEGPHAHEAVIESDNQRVYVPDLGLDRIRIYKLDPASAKLTPNDPPYAQAPAGFGPRHMVFGKGSKYAYVINELKPFVSVFEHDASNGSLKHLTDVPTLPDDFREENSGAEIRLHPSGKFLYTSNRGQDTIQVFTVDSASGALKRVQVVPTGGKEPRGFALDPSGHFLIAGNQKSNNVVVFKVHPKNGELSASGAKFEVPSPVDVLFVPVQ